MRYLFLTILMLTISQIRAEICFSADFYEGSFDSTKYLRDSIITHNNSTFTSPIFAVETRLDPPNPRYAEAHRSRRWFYFLMSGVKNQTVSLDINANDSKRPFYSYDNRIFHRYSEEEVPVQNGRITKRYDHDSVYIAYFVPYGVKRNDEALSRWMQSPNTKGFIIGETDLKTPLKMLVVTSDPHSGLIPDMSGNLNFKKEDEVKKIIYIHGRIHPSESPSSFHLEAIIDKLADGSKESKSLLENSIFYIMPFTNPDGVKGGFSRTTPKGINLEVNYIAKPTSTSAEVTAIKRFHSQIAAAGRFPDILLNMHSQSTPKTTYWVHNAASTSGEHHRKLMLFAGLTTDRNPYFSWGDLSYSKLRDYFIESWSRKLFKKHPLAVTFETPYSHYQSNPDGEWVTVENLQSQATNSINAIQDFLGLSTSSRITHSEPKKAAGFNRSKSNEYTFFGSQFLTAKKRGETVNYRLSLPQGEYAVYRWVVGKIAPQKEFGQNQWRYIENISHNTSEELQYPITAEAKGEPFDQILFIKINEK